MSGLPIVGIDLSHFQKDAVIDWPKAKAAGVRFVYHKATEGSTGTDEAYTARRAEAAAHGIRFGGYHFAHPAPGNARTEALHFLAVAKPHPGDLLPALDLEVNEHAMTPAALALWTHEWVMTVRHALGLKRVVIYTHFTMPGKFAAHLWVPRYSDANTPPVVPAQFSNWSIWQFSDGKYGWPSRVPGVPVPVDIDTLPGGPIRRRLLLAALTIPPGTKD